MPREAVQEPLVVDRDLGEAEPVYAWRLLCLIEAGYPLELAEQIALRSHSQVDLHVALELAASGCPHKTAAEILL